MSKQLDSLFSPEKLNQRWSNPRTPEQDDKNGWHKDLESTQVKEALALIATEILKNCKAAKHKKVMGTVLSDIQTDVAQMEDPDRENPPGPDEVFSVIDKIQQMEDLLDAFMKTTKA